MRFLWVLLITAARCQRRQHGAAGRQSGLGGRSVANRPRRGRPSERVDPRGIGALQNLKCDGAARAPPPAAAAACGAAHYDRYYGDGERVESIRSALAAAGANASARPTVLVLGAGHSGTSTVVAEILKMGYRQMTKTPGFERHYTEKHEDGFVVSANDRFVRRTGVDKVNVARDPRFLQETVQAHYGVGRCLVSDHPQLKKRLATYPRPGVLKDPRFVWTLHLWPDLFANEPPPVLVHVRRDPAAIRKSHEARGEVAFADLGMELDDAVASRVAWAEYQRSAWCGPKISIDVGALRNAGHANKFKKLRVG